MAVHTAGIIKITLSQTADKIAEYLQIMSADQTSLNIVLVADKFEVLDVRPKPKGGKK